MTRDPPSLRSIQLALIGAYVSMAFSASIFDAGWSDGREAVALLVASVVLQSLVLAGTVWSEAPEPDPSELTITPDGLAYEVARWPRLLRRTWFPQAVAAVLLWAPCLVRLEPIEALGVAGMCGIGCAAGLGVSAWLGGRLSAVRLAGHRLSVDGREVLLTAPRRQLVRVDTDRLEARTDEGTVVLRGAPSTLDEVVRLLEAMRPLPGDRSEVPRPLGALVRDAAEDGGSMIGSRRER